MIEMMDDAAYSKWLNSQDWLEIIEPAIRGKIEDLYREFAFIDVRDTAAVAIIQGGIHALEDVINAPRHHFDRLKREEENNATEFAVDTRGREPRRFIGYGRRG